MPRGNKGTAPVSLDIGGEVIDPAAVGGGNPANSGGDSGTGDIRDATGTLFDASIHSHPDTRNSDGSFRRKRGRKTGGGNKSKAAIYSDIEKSAEMLTRGLMIFHTSLAAMTSTPELVLDEAEAKGLSESGLTLLSLYDIKPDPKVEAAILFAGQVGLVYGTRFVAVRNRKSQEKAERGKGVAGVYDSNGAAMGTTEYTTQPNGQEWPLGSQPN